MDEDLWDMAEESLKEMLLDALRAAPKEMPKFIRGVFHDSVDANNLKKKSGGGWTKISGKYGGVDGCLYAPLAPGGRSTGKVGGRKGGKSKSKSKSKSSALLESFEDDFMPSNASLVEEWEEDAEEEDDLAPVQSHNLNLAGAYKIVGRICDQLSGQISKSQCVPDISVFAALLAIKEAGGPDIPMVWGRRTGDCPKIITCVKNDCTEPGKALGSVPDLVKIDDANHYRDEFQKLGYTAEDQE